VERARAIFFGSGAFAVPVLEAAAAAPELELVAVVTAPPRPVGRARTLTETAVATAAAGLSAPVLAPERLRDAGFQAALQELGAAVGVLADYGKLVPAAVLDLPPHGILNLHPSLLPRHRGAAPVPATILAGDDMTGVTLMLMDPGLDTGPIVAVERTPVGEGEDAPALEARLARLAAVLLADRIGPYLAGRLRPEPQPEEGVTLTRPLTREDGRLDPAAPARQLERQVRAYRPWPGTFVELADGERLAILGADVAVGAATDHPGTLVADGDGVALATVRDRLRLLHVRPAGGRAMDGAAYRRVRPGVVGGRVA
jgi:methionyl-tRNA formyltransferase